MKKKGEGREVFVTIAPTDNCEPQPNREKISVKFLCSKPLSQKLFIAQFVVLGVLNCFCLFQLTITSRRRELSCAEKTLYLTLLSSTIGYLLPPPRPRNKNVANTPSVVQNRQIPDSDFPDAAINDSLYNTSQSLVDAVSDEQWYCCYQKIGRQELMFFSQIAVIVSLVSFAILQMILSTNPECEEKTAYFMIISTCLAYLVPSIGVSL